MYYIHVEFDDSDGAPRKDALRDFGFDDAFLRDYLAIAAPGDCPARVVEVQRGRYGLVLRDAAGGLRETDLSAAGRLLHEAQDPSELPTVGDWVVVKMAEDGSGPGAIKAVLPRRSAFARRAPGDKAERVAAQVLATNVDSAFIVAAADSRWSPRRIERYVTLAYEAGVRPVVVITKADLAAEPETYLEEVNRLSPGIDAVLVCAPEGRGLDGLAPWLGSGKTVVLLGSSGAGKSTLLNALAGSRLAATQEVRGDDERGRHTTTHRELFRLPSGALMIDSPGLREIQLLAGEEALAEAFADVEALAAGCRFRDCRHEAEPGCAVRAALETGELDRGRYASWLKLGKEVAFLAAREDPRAAAERAERWKVINKSMRGYSKERRSIQGRAR
jgi:ribosome biogenesis GTPase